MSTEHRITNISNAGIGSTGISSGGISSAGIGNSQRSWIGDFPPQTTTEGVTYTTTGGTSSGDTFTLQPSPWNTSALPSKYLVMDLPKKPMPHFVFVDGRMLTLGIIGTDVECAFVGRSKIIFSPGIVSTLEVNSSKISIQYEDFINHYNVVGSDGPMLNVELVSTISLKKKRRAQKKTK